METSPLSAADLLTEVLPLKLRLSSKHKYMSSFFLKSVGKKSYKATKGAEAYEEMG